MRLTDIKDIRIYFGNIYKSLSSKYGPLKIESRRCPQLSVGFLTAFSVVSLKKKTSLCVV